MKFDSIHGTDRVYSILTRSGRCKYFSFSIKGYGSLDKKRERRFNRLLNLFNVKHVYTDVKF